MRTLARWLRKLADRIDLAGAPKRTQFSFTIEDDWGAIVNDTDQGCPLWYYGDADYERAHTTRTVPLKPSEVLWLTIGGRVGDDLVYVLGSAEVADAETTRRMNGHSVVAFEGAPRPGKVPHWDITLRATVNSFVTANGKDYQEAVRNMFTRAGVR